MFGLLVQGLDVFILRTIAAGGRSPNLATAGAYATIFRVEMSSILKLRILKILANISIRKRVIGSSACQTQNFIQRSIQQSELNEFTFQFAGTKKLKVREKMLDSGLLRVSRCVSVHGTGSIADRPNVFWELQSSVSIVTVYEMQDRCLFPGTGRHFSLHHPPFPQTVTKAQ